METKKYYIKKELILEIEVVQNPNEAKHPHVPIEPMDCRVEWKHKSTPDYHTKINSYLKIDPRTLVVIEDEKTRTHQVKSVKVVDDGPRSALGSISLHGMSERLLLETETETKRHLHLPHELNRYWGSDWEEQVEWGCMNYLDLTEGERTESDLTDFMPKEEIEDDLAGVQYKRWGILRVIDGGKNK